MSPPAPALEISLYQAISGLADDNGVGVCQALHPGSYIWSLSDNCLWLELTACCHIARHDQPRMNSESYCKPDASLLFELGI